MSANEAIVQACLLRFRPIMMTTLAALFGALPLALAGMQSRQCAMANCTRSNRRSSCSRGRPR